MIPGEASQPAVIDASVALKWVVPEPGSGAAVALRDALASGGREMAVPELFWAEVGNALWRLTRSAPHRLEPWEALGLLEALSSAPLVTVRVRPLAGRALEIACATGLSAYDATYVALAELKGSRLWTADRRLASAVFGSPWEGLVAPLGA